MKTLKIESHFFDLIQSGEKRYEFRKLEKGITSGVYKLISTFSEDYYYGFAKLKPIAINSTLLYIEHLDGTITPYMIIRKRKYYLTTEEHNFIKENYKDKKIDFIVYSVELVKETSE